MEFRVWICVLEMWRTFKEIVGILEMWKCGTFWISEMVEKMFVSILRSLGVLLKDVVGGI